MYEFYFPQYNVRQRKLLIKHTDWYKASLIMSEKLRKHRMKELTKDKEWFTDESPLFKAIQTQVLVCNGIHQCITTKL